MNHITTILAATALAGLGMAAAAEEVKIALNGVNDPAQNGEAAFVDGFSKALEGTGFEANVFPSGTLGKEGERFDQVAQGLIQVNLAAASTTFGMSPMVSGVMLPFIFEDWQEFDKVVEGSELLPQMNEPLEINGVKLSGFNYIGTGIGIHNTKKPITKLSDMSDLRFRALNKEQLALQEAMGANGTVIAWSEVANALQTGIADGYFNAPNSALRTGHTEFLTHFTQINLSPATRVVLISSDWYEGLDAEGQATIDTAITAGLAANRAWLVDWTQSVLQKQIDAGVTVSELEPGEREKMVQAVAPTYDTIIKPEHLSAVRAALESVR